MDTHGSGGYRVSRGTRLHNGIDICCDVGEAIRAFSSGVVTKIGYPYNPDTPKKGHLRYVQITDEQGLAVRYFYIKPDVAKGDTVLSGDVLGAAQGLGAIYHGITEHFHFEVLTMINGKKVFIDPEQYLAAV